MSWAKAPNYIRQFLRVKRVKKCSHVKVDEEQAYGLHIEDNLRRVKYKVLCLACHEDAGGLRV